MKTSEFVEKVEALPFVSKVKRPTNGNFLIVHQDVLARVGNDEMYSIDTSWHGFYNLHDDGRTQLMDILWQYISTPVEDREGEKRFRLMDKPELNKSLTNPYLNMNKETGRLMNGGSVDNVFYKTIFTESELKDLFTEQQLHWIEMTFDKEWIDE